MLHVTNLEKSYTVGKNRYEVLTGVNFHVAQEEFVAVMGPSGSGKTTLLNCISCYIPFDGGQITLGEQQLSQLSEDALATVRNQKLGFVFQDFMLLDGLTVRDNILLPRIIAGKVTCEAEEYADKRCKTFGITEIADKYPAEISGGKKSKTEVYAMKREWCPNCQALQNVNISKNDTIKNDYESKQSMVLFSEKSRMRKEILYV